MDSEDLYEERGRIRKTNKQLMNFVGSCLLGAAGYGMLWLTTGEMHYAFGSIFFLLLSIRGYSCTERLPESPPVSV
jgi:hypothetical protein